MCRFSKFYMWNNSLIESYYYHWIFCCNIKTIPKVESLFEMKHHKNIWNTCQALPLIRNQHTLSKNLCTKLPLLFKFPTGSRNKGHHMAQVVHGGRGGECWTLDLTQWYISLPLKDISDLVFKKIICIRFSCRKFGLTCRTTQNAKCIYLSACCKFHSFVTSM